ncbi:MAG: hypothetical protein H6708_22495 [Kofleriaceae bacterium]|nr:hypothetical protein [Myxococcales bacterium]MCB9563176.1 hypothetical protein [Kofleriaceae bacterium]
MSSFAGAAAALIAALGERVISESTYVETVGATSYPVRQRIGVRRDGDTIVHWATTQRGDGAAEPAEVARWDERGFVGALLAQAHLRAALGLPEPTEDEQIEGGLARLRAGERLRSGGADDGGRSGDGVVRGGWTELSGDGDRFVLELVSFEQARGGEPVYQTQRQELGLDELRGLLATSDPVRVLFGLPWR